MLATLCAFATIIQAGFDRDNFGVPHIQCATAAEAFRSAGFAVAEDRLWQMENSRRLARGTMAAAFGKAFVESDREVVKMGYSDAELQQQFDRLSEGTRSWIQAYCDGINEYIHKARYENRLPKQYEENGLEVAEWTPLDSVAIGVRLFQMFGRGGAGEIRNLALLGYLQNQPKLKGKYLDVFDDLAWENDPKSIPTVNPSEDPLAKHHPSFYWPDRATTQRHLATLPKTGLLELLPGVRLASRETSSQVAESRAVAYKVGSYAIVVGPKRSTTGRPLLLSGPQMGFTNPSVVHEISISSPEYTAVGADVPGVPGVIVGFGPKIAWGLTSGVADTDDIFVSPMREDDHYGFGSKDLPIEHSARQIDVKGSDPVMVDVLRTRYGPVVISSKNSKAYYSRKSSFWMHEMDSYEGLLALPMAATGKKVSEKLETATMSFNLFYATTSGEIGYRYLGRVPVRANGIDPRLPTPGIPENDWKGFVSPSQMPQVANPASGLIVNWNNKPASWWPNSDTPVWGSIFRNEVLLNALPKGKISPTDVELAPWIIARRNVDALHFANLFEANGADPDGYLAGYPGTELDNTVAPLIFRTALSSLREELFLGSIGNLISPDNFSLALQPSLIERAIQGKTKFDYLGGRKPREILNTAMAKARAKLTAQRGSDPEKWLFNTGGINVPNEPPIPYSNRGTYIQIIELRDHPMGKNVLPPGIASSGPHAFDQVPLARAWQYKPMHLP